MHVLVLKWMDEMLQQNDDPYTKTRLFTADLLRKFDMLCVQMKKKKSKTDVG